jgi:hypothetical protein
VILPGVMVVVETVDNAAIGATQDVNGVVVAV